MNAHLAIAVVATSFCALALAACGETQTGSPPPIPAPVGALTSAETAKPAAGVLAGTHWRLLEIQSMNDTIGTTRPEDPALYTLAFGADGQVAMRLDCNRGTAPFKETPAMGGDTGSLAMGPVAMTRASCPPPSLDERIARDTDFVRNYVLRDGRLALTLEANAATYFWESVPAGSPAGAP